MTVVMVALIAAASLAVDYGHAQVVKSELRRAAVAAARAAASQVATPSAARQLAYELAHQNMADGKPVDIIPSQDVVFITWDSTSRTYKTLSGSAEATANAVIVTTQRTAARGNPVGLMWAGLLGRGACDVRAISIAAVAPESYGVVGLNSISMSGNTSDSYWSSGTGGTGNSGNIASNGSITLSGGATIHGNVRGTSVSGGTVTGNIAPLPQPLSFPPGDAGSYATTNDDGLIPSWALSGKSFSLGKNQTLTLPGGHYYFNNFSMATGSVLTFTGPATIYCYGTFSMTGQTNTESNVPQNLNLVMCPSPTGALPGDVTITAGAALYANVYAPQSNVTIGGGGSIYGSVLGLNVKMSGTGSIHYDLSLKGNGAITIVK
jgi:Flp pilus assembly protein TadG